MQRRCLLALGALVVMALLAGCSAPGSLEMRPVTDAELATEASRTIEPGSAPHVRTDRPPRAVVNASVANGSTTVTAVEPPVAEGLPVAADGAYYDLTWTVVDERPASIVPIGIDYNASAPSGTAIAYGELPRVDREALAALLPQRGPARTDGIDAGFEAVYTAAETDESVLVPAQRYDVVVYEGERYPIEVEPTRETTLSTYRYEATRVADDAGTYASHLRERYTFALSNLTDAERSVVGAAVANGTYYAESDDDAGFASVLERFRDREAIAEDGASGLWLVRYEGERYLARLRYGGFLGG